MIRAQYRPSTRSPANAGLLVGLGSDERGPKGTWTPPGTTARAAELLVASSIALEVAQERKDTLSKRGQVPSEDGGYK